MTYKESYTVELKREFTPEIKKEFVAFANSYGGTIYIGIDDGGNVIGLENANEILSQISNMIRDAIKPDITMFTSYIIENIDNKDVIAVTIQRGTNCPYYIAEKGLKPSGVYVRQGTTSANASENAIRQMIKETDGDKFEDIRSFNQELTFEAAKIEFKKRNVDFSETQMKTLGIINSENIYTNLGLLISDECTHIVKVAVFDGINKSIFKDRREFNGSLLKQIAAVYEYIDIHNNTKAEFSGLNRIDSRDYPEEAVREALLNAIVHRDYSFSGSTLINIYIDRIEFVTIGGLAKGISINDIMLGISQTRNEKLATIFYRLKLIEAYGTGIIKIMDSYKSSFKKPELKISDNAFLISLPNFNAFIENIEIKSHEQAVVDYISMHNTITRKEVETICKIGQTMAGRILRDMVKNGQIKTMGSGAGTKYTARGDGSFVL